MLTKILNVVLVLAVLGYGLYYIYKLPKYREGEVAPDFSAITHLGQEFQLSNLRGGYVLLDFWGSWCGPCRSESSALVALNEKFKYNNSYMRFDIVSVAIENNEAQWKKAIKNDGLKWPYHISQEGRFKSPIAELYGVKEIPTKYLIGPDGQVIFTNPSFQDLNTYLADKIR